MSSKRARTEAAPAVEERPAKHARIEEEDDYVLINSPTTTVTEHPRAGWIQRLRQRGGVLAKLPSWTVGRGANQGGADKENGSDAATKPTWVTLRRKPQGLDPLPAVPLDGVTADVEEAAAAQVDAAPAAVLGLVDLATNETVEHIASTPTEPSKPIITAPTAIAPPALAWRMQHPSPLGQRPLGAPYALRAPVIIVHPLANAQPTNTHSSDGSYAGPKPKHWLNPHRDPLRFALSRTWWLGHERWWRTIPFDFAKRWMVAPGGVREFRRRLDEEDQRRRQRESKRCSTRNSVVLHSGGVERKRGSRSIKQDAETSSNRPDIKFQFNYTPQSVQEQAVVQMLEMRMQEDQKGSATNY